MEKRKISCSYSFLVIILFATVCFLTDYIVIDRKLRENNSDDSIIETSKYEVIEQSELAGIIDNQLSIFYGKKSLNDITNQKKLSLALNLMNKKSGGRVETFSKEELESSFNSSIISNLGIEHENIVPVKSWDDDGNVGYGYTYKDGVYADFTSSNSGYSSASIIYHKVVSFSELDGKYTLSVKYLWGGYCEALMDCPYIYSSYLDSSNGQNSIVKIPDDVVFGSTEELDNWGKENFSIYESQLEKYNFVFVKENGKINLVDFYVD